MDKVSCSCYHSDRSRGGGRGGGSRAGRACRAARGQAAEEATEKTHQAGARRGQGHQGADTCPGLRSRVG